MANGRLGDVIRAVGAAGPLADDQLDLVAALFPAPPEARAARPSPGAPRPARLGATAPGWTPAARGRASPAGSRSRRRAPRALLRRGRAGWARVRRVAVDLAHGARRHGRWLATAAALPAAVIALSAAGVLPRMAGLVAVVALAAVVVVVATVTAFRRFLEWRRSPLLGSRATWERPGADPTRAQSGPALDLGPDTPPVRPWAEPLVAARQERALALALARAYVPGPLDLPALVAQRARRLARTRPPRRLQPTLRKGVQLLVDRGPALAPFRDDVAGLRRALIRVASSSGVEVLSYMADPGQVQRRRPFGHDRPYLDLAPPAGTTVVVVGDLGASSPRSGPPPAPAGAWLAHHAAVRGAGCRAVYLSPYPPTRWRPGLAGQLPARWWWEGLSVTAVARLDRGWRRRT